MIPSFCNASLAVLGSSARAQGEGVLRYIVCKISHSMKGHISGCLPELYLTSMEISRKDDGTAQMQYNLLLVIQ